MPSALDVYQQAGVIDAVLLCSCERSASSNMAISGTIHSNMEDSLAMRDQSAHGFGSNLMPFPNPHWPASHRSSPAATALRMGITDDSGPFNHLDATKI